MVVVMLPDRTPLARLETRGEVWQDGQQVWQTIRDLREGYPTLLKKASRYLPARPGEKPDVYALRKAKLAYTPVMAGAIRKLVSKLASAPMYLQGSDYWQAWAANTNGQGRNQAQLVSILMSTMAYYGRVYVIADRPVLPEVPRSLAEQPDSARPYLSVYEPLEVTNEGQGWYMTRRTETRQAPLAEPELWCIWTILTELEVARYECPVKLAPDGSVGQMRLAGGQWVRPGSKLALVPQVAQYQHELGRPPVVAMTVPDELWVAKTCYGKQLQHMLIESAWTDAGSIAGTIQRVFTPPPAVPLDDPRALYETPNYDGLEADNAHILIGSAFDFAESKGSALGSLSAMLSKIEGQIRELASLGFVESVASGGPQSGLAKQLDQSTLNDDMRDYGSFVLKLYQRCLEVVAELAGQDVPAVSGLSDYSSDNLSAMLEHSKLLVELAAYLPPVALTLWFGKVLKQLLGDLGPDDQRLLDNALEIGPLKET